MTRVVSGWSSGRGWFLEGAQDGGGFWKELRTELDLVAGSEVGGIWWDIRTRWDLEGRNDGVGSGGT